MARDGPGAADARAVRRDLAAGTVVILVCGLGAGRGNPDLPAGVIEGALVLARGAEAGIHDREPLGEVPLELGLAPERIAELEAQGAIHGRPLDERETGSPLSLAPEEEFPGVDAQRLILESRDSARSH